MINLSFDELRVIAQLRNISEYKNKSKDNLIKPLRKAPKTRSTKTRNKTKTKNTKTSNSKTARKNLVKPLCQIKKENIILMLKKYGKHSK